MMSDELPLNARSLSYKWVGRRCVLEFDDENLTFSHKDGLTLAVTKTPLWRLLPEFLTDRSFSERSRHHGRVARYSLPSAVVVYFSEINTHVPLLAPTLLALSAYQLFRAVQGEVPLQKTKIVTEWNEEIAVIPHHEDLESHRKRFEGGLLEAIREARRKHYDEA